MFDFIGVKSYGSTSCPCCGAEGKYIYEWQDENGHHAAMYGCFQRLTASINFSDIDRAKQRAFEKKAKGLKLNGWDKTIIRMCEYINENKLDSGKVAWANSKICQAVMERKSYQSKF